MCESAGMRVIIAGSRDGVRYADVCSAIAQSGFNVAAVVSGGCRGTDRLGEDWANNHDIPVFIYPADWATHGRAAGPIRNATMASNADALVAIWDGKSRGTKNMIDPWSSCVKSHTRQSPRGAAQRRHVPTDVRRGAVAAFD